MSKIEIIKWKDFRIKDIFETVKKGNKIQVPTGSSISIKELKEEGNIPRITVSGVNNGIIGNYYSESKDFRIYNNFISVSFLGTVFYQKGFASLDMKVHCLKPKNIDLNENIALFLITVIKKGLSTFSYSDQISSTTLPEMRIKLPITDAEEPDWNYMEKFISDSLPDNTNRFNEFKKIEASTKNIDISSWKDFHLYDLFYVDPGTKLDKSKMKIVNPTIDFVGRANANNGVTIQVDEIEGLIPFEAGNLTLSLGGEYLGSCFIQDNDFYTSQNVNVLIPKTEMSLNCKLFISTVIFKESRTHYKAFIDELNRHVKTDFSFKLPVTENAEPDWDYMEKYIESIKQHAKVSLMQLKCI